MTTGNQGSLRQRPADDAIVLRSVTDAVLSPGGLVAVVTAWFYCLVTTTFAARVEGYGAQGHWFNLGIGRWAIFSIQYVLHAAYLFVPFLALLLCVERRRFVWIVLYCIWGASLAYWLGLPCTIYWVDGALADRYGSLFIIGLYLVGPQILRKWNAGRARRFNATTCLELAESQRVCESPTASQADKEHAKRKRDEIMAGLEIDLGRLHKRLARTLTAVSFLAAHLFIAQFLAATQTRVERFHIVRSLGTKAYDEASPSTQLLFTDGMASLLAKRTEDRVIIVFENPQAGIEQILSSTPSHPSVRP